MKCKDRWRYIHEGKYLKDYVIQFYDEKMSSGFKTEESSFLEFTFSSSGMQSLARIIQSVPLFLVRFKI